MNAFTQRRFLAFPKEKQHKKSAELLRALYRSFDADKFSHYNEIQSWMGESRLTSAAKQVLSDRYHQHLKQAHVCLSEHSLLPAVRQGDHSQPLSEALDITVYLDHIRSAHNVGSIIRTVEAFNLGSIFFSTDTPFANHPQVEKTSMGSVKFVDCHHCESIDSLPGPLIALETSDDAIPLQEYLFPQTCCIAVGNEEYGISKEVLEKADAIVEIPMMGRKNSLNVANAFAIVAATVSNQLRSKDCPCT